MIMSILMMLMIFYSSIHHAISPINSQYPFHSHSFYFFKLYPFIRFLILIITILLLLISFIFSCCQS